MDRRKTPGIREGDVIVAIGGAEVAAAADVGSADGSLEVGDGVEVEVVRSSGERETLELTLGTRPLPVDLP